LEKRKEHRKGERDFVLLPRRGGEMGEKECFFPQKDEDGGGEKKRFLHARRKKKKESEMGEKEKKGTKKRGRSNLNITL